MKPATKPPRKSMATQRTFESSDDLLSSASEAENDDDLEVPPIVVSNKENGAAEAEVAAKPKSVAPNLWDCKAVHWPPHSIPRIAKTMPGYLKRYYLPLEVLFVGFFVLACYKLPDFIVAAHHRPIPYQTTATGDVLVDLTFDNPYHHNETIPGPLLTLLTFVLPMAIFAVFGNLLGPRGDTHAAICMYCLAIGMKIFVVACIKNYAGYFRPSFYNMCQFDPVTLVCQDETTSARESFPSGHAATALSSMTLISLYLLGKVRGGTRQRGVKSMRNSSSCHYCQDAISVDDILWAPSYLEKILSVLAIAPVFLGMFIATSRVRDNWHHPADVLCGGIIGVGCAMFAHGLWFPPVYSYYAGIPLATIKKVLVAQHAMAIKKAAPPLDLEASE